MSRKTPSNGSAPTPGRVPPPLQPRPQIPPVEPVEVIGRHKNSGQKDHKGAR